MIRIHQISSKKRQSLLFLLRITFDISVEFFKFYYGDFLLLEGILLINILKDIVLEKFK
jgi:hypothetical protein